MRDIWGDILSTVKKSRYYQELAPWTDKLIFNSYENNILNLRFSLSGMSPLFPDYLHKELNGICSQATGNKEIKININQDNGYYSLEADSEKNFNSFFVNSDNRLALAACRAVCKYDRLLSYNPLYIYSSTGMGKTHLLNSVVNEYSKNHPSSQIRFLTAEMFRDQFFQAVKEDRLSFLRELNSSASVFIIDGIHKLYGETNTLNEFISLFDLLHSAKAQIILSSDCTPKQLHGFPEALISRFQWGLTVEITVPEAITREQIVKSLFNKRNINIENHLIRKIVDSHRGSIRDLEGMVNTICSHSTLLEAPIDQNLIYSVCHSQEEQEISEPVKPISLPDQNLMAIDIVDIVAGYFRLNRDALLSKIRTRSLAYPRQVGMYLAKQLTDSSLEEIGQAFGGRDHSTVKHGCEKIERMSNEDTKVKLMLEQLKEKISCQPV